MGLILYQYEFCPFCAKVRAKLEELNIPYEAINVERDPNDPLRKEMRERSGVATVPVIKHGDVWLGESADIIAYVEKHKEELKNVG